MPRKKTPSIPLELQQIKAYELSQQRFLEGKKSNADDDWNDAGEYLAKHPRKMLVWKLKKIRLSIKEFLNVCWKVLVFPFWLLYKLPELFYQSDTKTFALDVVKTIITALGLIATFIAGVGLFLNYWSSEKNTQLTQERLVTERFSKAIDQLGSSNDVVILGGIYSLERIAKDSPKDQTTVMEILSSFVRKNSPASEEVFNNYVAKEYPLDQIIFSKKKTLTNNRVTIEIQAALTIVGRRNYVNGKIHKDFIDLTNTNLQGANLSKTNLNEANLFLANLLGADLFGADLRGTNLRGANLFVADLRTSDLRGANLQSSNLKNADLRGANVSRADLRRANLVSTLLDEKTDLQNSNLRGAKLFRVNLRGVNLHRANLLEANLSKFSNFTFHQIKMACHWKEAKYEPATLRDKLENDRASDPKEYIDCSQWKIANSDK